MIWEQNRVKADERETKLAKQTSQSKAPLLGKWENTSQPGPAPVKPTFWDISKQQGLANGSQMYYWTCFSIAELNLVGTNRRSTYQGTKFIRKFKEPFDEQCFLRGKWKKSQRLNKYWLPYLNKFWISKQQCHTQSNEVTDAKVLCHPRVLAWNCFQ